MRGAPDVEVVREDAAQPPFHVTILTTDRRDATGGASRIAAVPTKDRYTQEQVRDRWYRNPMSYDADEAIATGT